MNIGTVLTYDIEITIGIQTPLQLTLVGCGKF